MGGDSKVVMRNNIAFDLDETLVDIMPLTKSLLKEVYGVDLIEENTYKVITEPQISYEQLWEIFRLVYKKVDEVRPTEGSVELLTKLYELTKDPIKIVTARPVEDVPETRKLLNTYFKVPYILYAIGSDSKCKYLTGIDYFVDDRRATAIKLGGKGIKVFVPEKYYNKGIVHENVHYINNLNDLIPIIDKFIKK